MAISGGLPALATVLLALAGLATGSAVAAGGEARGAQLLDAVQSGELDCDRLDDTDFAAMGEFVMGRMLGSRAAHDAMDQMMASMMGASDLDRMHEVMGLRFAGCGNPRFPESFGGMMGVMGVMAGDFGRGGGMMGGGPAGMMGDRSSDGDALPGEGFGPAAMMDFDGDDDDDAGAWMAVAMLLLIAGAAVAMILAVRTGRRRDGTGPLDLLAQRFARGEIGVEEYAEGRRLLEEGGR